MKDLFKVSNLLSFLALIVSFATLLTEGSYKKFFKTDPDVNVRVLEADNSRDIKILVSNSGGLPVVITRVWLRETEGNELDFSLPIQLSLKGEERLVDVDKVVILNAKSSETSSKTLPSLLEDHEVRKENKQINDLFFINSSPEKKCKLILELSSIKNYRKSIEEDFYCVYASVLRKPMEK